MKCSLVLVWSMRNTYNALIKSHQNTKECHFLSEGYQNIKGCHFLPILNLGHRWLSLILRLTKEEYWGGRWSWDFSWKIKCTLFVHQLACRDNVFMGCILMSCFLGLDVIAQAQSGTGKTATFSISILQQIDVSLLECQALVLAPTRELAQQV